jgi:hypothetical protein
VTQFGGHFPSASRWLGLIFPALTDNESITLENDLSIEIRKKLEFFSAIEKSGLKAKK